MTRRPLQRVQAALVARRYFIGQQTKSDIAEELGISRFKVARLIDLAIQEEIIRFVVTEPGDLNTELAEALRRRHGLKAVLVLDGPDLPFPELTQQLGLLAARLLEETLSEGQLLGIAWGRTLAATAQALTGLPKVDVIQVAGSPAGLDFSQNPVELVHRIAGISGGTAFPIYGPMWAEDPQLMRRLRMEPSIADTMQRYDRIDVLAVGIGSWRPPDSCFCAGFPALWRDEALAAGVRADLCATLIDDEGRIVSSPLDTLGLGLTSDQLRRVPNVIGIGGGARKTDAIAAVLKGRWISMLVTDAGTARTLLEKT
ncbi:MAG TPA: sugar-binding domain-containing protein [Stellaceae bacterium]|nr:sugar-binding domain-containing protein [Stellaceae bacterium]